MAIFNDRRCRVVFVSLCLFTFSTGQYAQSQVSDQRRGNRRALVEGLLRGLLESQIEKAQNPAKNLPPKQAYPKAVLPVEAQRPVVNGELVQIKKTLQDWSGQCDHLINELRRIEHTTPAARPLLAEAAQLRVNIDLLARRAQNVPQPIYLIDEFRVIDQQWRSLNYSLTRIPAVASKIRQCIDFCNQYDQQLSKTFDITPQFDTQQVLILASEMSTSVHHLSQDVRYEVRQEPARSNLIRQSAALHGALQQSPAVIRRGDYDAITRLYKRNFNQWRKLSQAIGGFPSARLRHDVQEIETISQRLREQLFIPYELDRGYLAQLSTNVGQSSAGIFQQITLQDLITMENPQGLLAAARGFEQQCDSFSGALRGGADQTQLTAQFVQFDNNWADVHAQCRVLKTRAMELELAEIDFSMQTLRESFGSQPLLDHSSMLRIAARLEDLSHELERAVIGESKSIRRPTQKFHERALELNQKTLSGRYYEPKDAELKQLASSWNQFKQSLQRYHGPRTAQLNALRQQIEPLMVKLQVIYSQ